MGKSQKFRAILVTLIVVAAVLIDQIIKVAVKLSMYMHESIPVFGDWFSITFTENPGMAFGMELCRFAYFVISHEYSLFIIYIRLFIMPNSQ